MKVSLVIPTFNEEAYLERCLQSVRAQTIAVSEIIVVDNNSADKTQEIARNYKAKLLVETKQGIVFARNRGFNAAKGEIIARIDADTQLDIDWVERVIKDFNNKDIVAVTGVGTFYDLPLKKIHSNTHEFIYYKGSKLLLGYEVLWGSNMALRKSAWRQVKSKVCLDTNIHEDIDLSYHLSKIGKIMLDKNLRVSVSSRSMKDIEKAIEHLKMWPKIHKN